MPETVQLLLSFATALAVGLLIGTERGWSARDTEDTRLIGGIRTFGLVGLLGGLAALLGQQYGLTAWISITLIFGLLVIAGYIAEQRNTGDIGVTSPIALLLTFLLGSLALSDQRALAAACAVVIALLLSLKQPLHSAVRRLSGEEVSGALKLLFISLVMLPVLPNEGYGPWRAFNPYATWWMVVLIAAIGFAAYSAIRVIGPRKGLLVSALLGGMVSSTAMTMTLARLSERTHMHAILACGLLATSALMFPRVLLEVGVVNSALLGPLLLPLSICALTYAGGALWFLHKADSEPANQPEPFLKNPFELAPALRFAALLAVIAFLVEGGRRYFGDVGVYVVALLSGLTDVDAITLSLSRNAIAELDSQVAVQGIYLAALSNSLVKGLLIALIGGRQLAVRTLPIMATGLLAGLASLLLI
ncbi:MAG: uncharacterized membrane protein (DUF4010 family) [Pseudomonas sp.]|jgi:uncharacterized membrane protein (DUF4010 family)